MLITVHAINHLSELADELFFSKQPITKKKMKVKREAWPKFSEEMIHRGAACPDLLGVKFKVKQSNHKRFAYSVADDMLDEYESQQ